MRLHSGQPLVEAEGAFHQLEQRGHLKTFQTCIATAKHNKNTLQLGLYFPRNSQTYKAQLLINQTRWMPRTNFPLQTSNRQEAIRKLTSLAETIQATYDLPYTPRIIEL